MLWLFKKLIAVAHESKHKRVKSKELKLVVPLEYAYIVLQDHLPFDSVNALRVHLPWLNLLSIGNGSFAYTWPSGRTLENFVKGEGKI